MRPGAAVQGGSWGELVRLIRGSGFIFVCRVSGAGITLVAQLLLARWMGAAELGVYVLAFAWALLLASVSTLGFIPAAIRFVAYGQARGEPGYARSFYRFALRVVITVSLVLGAAAAGLAWLLPPGTGPDAHVVTIALAFMPVLAVLQMTSGVANGYAQFVLGFLPANVLRPLLFCTLVIGAWLWLPALEARLAMSLQAVAVVTIALPTLIVFWRFVESQGDVGASNEDRRLWLLTAVRLLAATLFAGYFPEMITTIAGVYLPSDELAVLHISLRISTLVIFGVFAVDAFTGPDIARLHADGDRSGLAAVVNRATRLRFWAAVVVVMFFALIGRWLLQLFGPEFVAGYPALIILSVGQLIQAAVGPVVRLLSISGHETRCLKVFAAALLLAVVLIALLAPRWGVMGAAVAATLDMLFWALWMRILCAKHVGIRPSFLWFKSDR